MGQNIRSIFRRQDVWKVESLWISFSVVFQHSAPYSRVDVQYAALVDPEFCFGAVLLGFPYLFEADECCVCFVDPVLNVLTGSPIVVNDASEVCEVICVFQYLSLYCYMCWCIGIDGHDFCFIVVNDQSYLLAKVLESVCFLL